MSDRYAVIAAHRAEFPVRLMCRMLDVSATGFYAAQRRPPSRHAQHDVQLQQVITTTFARCRSAYGSPRIKRELRQAGHCVSEKRVARLMRHAGLSARARRRFVCTTDSRHAFPIAPNLVQRDFTIHRPLNTTWASDTTYLPTDEGWLYLAVVLDVASRRVVGWATSAQNDTSLVLSALQRALALRTPPCGLVQHSDRGSTYASVAYQTVLREHGVISSMSRAGDCWDNAVAESFFATLEWELFGNGPFATRASTHRALIDYIDTWYNRERMHSTLHYRSPIQHEQYLLCTPQAA